jgi:hypothetical protein
MRPGRRIGLAISLPDPLPKRRLPIVMVLGGLATGERNIRHVPGGGDNAIVGYDWPIPAPLPRGWECQFASKRDPLFASNRYYPDVAPNCRS